MVGAGEDHQFVIDPGVADDGGIVAAPFDEAQVELQVGRRGRARWRLYRTPQDAAVRVAIYSRRTTGTAR